MPGTRWADRTVSCIAAAVDVVLEPPAQPRPGSSKGLVGDLQDPVVTGHEAGRDQHLDQPVVLGVRADQASGDPGAHGLSL